MKLKPFENLCYPEEKRQALEDKVKKLAATGEYSFQYLERVIEDVLQPSNDEIMKKLKAFENLMDSKKG
jgi:hypothetical protein